MKLKQLVFSSLPRSKAKQKKKLQEQHDQKLKLQQKQRSQSDSQERRHLRQRNNPAHPVQEPSILEERPSTLPFLDINQNDTPHSLGNTDGAIVDSKKEKVKPKNNELSANLNIKTEEQEGRCACYKHLRQKPDSPEDFQPISRSEARYYNLSSSSSMEDSGFSSLPKTRTRIKTNPWLPSPRSTPSTTPELSPMASSSPSPVYYDRRSFDSGCQPQSDSSPGDCPDDSTKHKVTKRRDDIYEEITALSIKAQACFSSQNSDSSLPRHSGTDSDSLLQQSFLSETDNTETDIRVTTDNTSTSEKCLKFSNKVVNTLRSEESDLSSSLDDFTQGNDSIFSNGNVDTQVSFEYEEAFESQLEGNGHYINPLNNLNASDDSGDDDDDLFNDPLGSRAHDFDSEYCPSSNDSSCNDEINSETETDDTICDDYYTETGLRRGGRPTAFNDVFRDYYHYADDEDDEDEEEDKENNLSFFSLGSFTNLYHTKPEQMNGSPLEPNGPGRAIIQPRLTLSEKVNRLRRHKHIVDEKIREAQEEERIRTEEKMKFQRQMDLHRKQLLLRTLQDLQNKLESQSERLQQTYSAVLYMQQAVINNRQENPHRRHQLALVDTREAPF